MDNQNFGKNKNSFAQELSKNSPNSMKFLNSPTESPTEFKPIFKSVLIIEAAVLLDRHYDKKLWNSRKTKTIVRKHAEQTPKQWFQRQSKKN